MVCVGAVTTTCGTVLKSCDIRKVENRYLPACGHPRDNRPLLSFPSQDPLPRIYTIQYTFSGTAISLGELQNTQQGGPRAEEGSGCLPCRVARARGEAPVLGDRIPEPLQYRASRSYAWKCIRVRRANLCRSTSRSMSLHQSNIQDTGTAQNSCSWKPCCLVSNLMPSTVHPM